MVYLYLFYQQKVVKMQGEVGLTNIKKDDIIQIQRKGYFRCDQEYSFRFLYDYFAKKSKKTILK